MFETLNHYVQHRLEQRQSQVLISCLQELANQCLVFEQSKDPDCATKFHAVREQFLTLVQDNPKSFSVLRDLGVHQFDELCSKHSLARRFSHGAVLRLQPFLTLPKDPNVLPRLTEEQWWVELPSADSGLREKTIREAMEIDVVALQKEKLFQPPRLPTL